MARQTEREALVSFLLLTFFQFRRCCVRYSPSSNCIDVLFVASDLLELGFDMVAALASFNVKCEVSHFFKCKKCINSWRKREREGEGGVLVAF